MPKPPPKLIEYWACAGNCNALIRVPWYAKQLDGKEHYCKECRLRIFGIGKQRARRTAAHLALKALRKVKVPDDPQDRVRIELERIAKRLQRQAGY